MIVSYYKTGFISSKKFFVPVIFVFSGLKRGFLKKIFPALIITMQIKKTRRELHPQPRLVNFQGYSFINLRMLVLHLFPDLQYYSERF
jgi:hypothetical protein